MPYLDGDDIENVEEIEVKKLQETPRTCGHGGVIPRHLVLSISSKWKMGSELEHRLTHKERFVRLTCF